MTITLSKETLVKRTVENILHDYAHATGIACVYVDIRGHERSTKYKFTKFCQFMRSIPAFRDRCYQCDLCGGVETLKKQYCCPYRCHSGLVDFAVPIIQENKLYGFIISGQVVLQDKRIEYLQQPTYWHDNANAKLYFESAPAYRYEEIMSASRVLQTLVTSQFPCCLQAQGYNMSVLTENERDMQEPEEINIRPEIKTAISFIKRNLHSNLCLKRIAEEIFLSESYLSKIFKQEMNMNLMQYINQCRICEAKKMLCQTNESVDCIGKKLGYHRTSYFCKIFKQYTGETLHVYRKRNSIEK